MGIQAIIRAIDAEIGRLRRARDLLAGGTFQPKRSARKKSNRRPRVLQQAGATPQFTVERPIPERTGVEPRVPNNDRKGERISSPAPRSALVGSVPAGPVIVSAAQARTARDQREHFVHSAPERTESSAQGERTLAFLIAKLGRAS